MFLMPAGNASPWTGPTGNNTYLLPGAVPALVDAGVGNPEHVAAIADALRGAPLAIVLVTHNHPDHMTGIPALLGQWPMLSIRNVPPDACRDGETIDAGDMQLRALHTPGHSPDHFCFFHERSGDLYCGDLARAGGTIVIPASAGGDLRLYLASLRRILALCPRRLLPGHGPIVTDPAALLEKYLEHRAQRDVQIIEAMREGCETVERIVGRVYGDLPAPLMRGAADTIRAHLNKLSDEGSCRAFGNEWRLT